MRKDKYAISKLSIFAARITQLQFGDSIAVINHFVKNILMVALGIFNNICLFSSCLGFFYSCSHRLLLCSFIIQCGGAVEGVCRRNWTNLFHVLIVSHNLESLNSPLTEITQMSFRSATSQQKLQSRFELAPSLSSCEGTFCEYYKPVIYLLFCLIYYY